MAYVNYVLFILKSAYASSRSGRADGIPQGRKTALVEAAVESFFPGKFTLSDLERACPGSAAT